MQMVCERCRRTGIEWIGLGSLCPFTKCPHCGGTNCQLAEEPEPEDEEEGEES